MKNINFIKISLFVAVLALVIFPSVMFANNHLSNDPSTWPDAGEHDAQNNQNVGNTGGGCAGAYTGVGGLEGFVRYLTCILVGSVVPLLFALAFVVFIWGVVQFIANSSDENKRAQGKQFMVWGLVGLFVMFSIWGLVQLLRKTVDPTAGPLGIPTLPKSP